MQNMQKLITIKKLHAIVAHRGCPVGGNDSIVASMNADTPLEQEPAEIGPKSKWLGTFEIWMRDEYDSKVITQSEYREIMTLFQSWKADKNPQTNGDTKKALTAWLKEIIWNRT